LGPPLYFAALPDRVKIPLRGFVIVPQPHV
jgi:hypothetical protein